MSSKRATWENASVDRFYEKDIGGLLSMDQSCLYFIGIIDILTEYK